MSSFYTDKTPDPVKNAKGIHLITSLTPNGRKVHILLEELKDVYGLEWTTSLIDLDTKEQKKNGSSNSIPTVYNHFLVQENQTTSTNPIPPGRIPILIDNTRSPPHPVMESSAELLYLVSSIDKDHQFWFSDPIEQSEAYQWLIFWHASGQPIQGQYNYFRRHTIDPHATTRFRDEVLRIYQVLEAHLSGKHSCNAREYLAGPGSGKYSIVDINAWAWIRTYRSIGFSEDEIAAWPSLGQWVDRIAERPAVQRGLGEWYDEDVHPELVVRTE